MTNPKHVFFYSPSFSISIHHWQIQSKSFLFKSWISCVEWFSHFKDCNLASDLTTLNAPGCLHLFENSQGKDICVHLSAPKQKFIETHVSGRNAKATSGAQQVIKTNTIQVHLGSKHVIVIFTRTTQMRGLIHEIYTFQLTPSSYMWTIYQCYHSNSRWWRDEYAAGTDEEKLLRWQLKLTCLA